LCSDHQGAYVFFNIIYGLLSNGNFVIFKITRFYSASAISIAMQSAILAVVAPTVSVCDRPTVCHTLVSCQNDSSCDHAVFTGG